MPSGTEDKSKHKEFESCVQTKSRFIKNSQRNEIKRGKFLLDLYQKSVLLSEKELNDYFLDNAVSLTGSTIGFFHLVSDDQKSIILTAWNGKALQNCKANYSSHYPIEKAGNWVDCVRLKRPVIYNDFATSPNQKGFPSGHVLVKRFMSIPIFENDKVKIVFGVGNKTAPYTEDDVVQLQLIAIELSKIYRQRQAENTIRESEKKYRSLFENMLDGFAFCKMVFDEQDNPIDFVYLEINDAFERITGLKREIVVGKKVTDTIPGIKEANPELFEIYGRVAFTCQEERFEIFFKPLGLWLYVSVYCPQKGYFAAVFEDITNRKDAEVKLEEYRKNLEMLVEERTKQLKDSERMAAIGQTAGMVGHDIRNPLQAIIGDLYLAKDDVFLLPEVELKKSLQESLNNIEENLLYIEKIVADLQDYARPLHPVIENVNIEKAIEDAFLVVTIPSNLEVSIIVEEGISPLNSDLSLLKRILVNLIQNAVQAMPEGGKLTVNAYKEENWVTITVKDNGIGIPEAAKDKLFTPMFTTKSKGQGFGLAVIKRMTEALGGSVTFESQEGKGATFMVRLPHSPKQ